MCFTHLQTCNLLQQSFDVLVEALWWKRCPVGFDNVVRHLVLLPKQTFIATFVSRHVTTTNFSELPLELSGGPWAGSSEFKHGEYNLYFPKKKTLASWIWHSNQYRSMVRNDEIAVSAEIVNERALVQRDYDLQVKLTETVIV